MNALLPLPLSLNRRGREGGRGGKQWKLVREEDEDVGLIQAIKRRGTRKERLRKGTKEGKREREREREGERGPKIKKGGKGEGPSCAGSASSGEVDWTSPLPASALATFEALRSMDLREQ
jgi:hypothetical protein